MAFTVTATQGGSTAAGMAIMLRVVTGQAASQPGTVASATNTTPNLSVNPAATGSWVYGAILGLSSVSYAAVAGTTLKQNVAASGLEYLAVRTTGTTTAATPVTVGATAPVNGISICLCEIEAATTLAEDASSPAGSGFVAATAITTASFTPPAGSLLVLMVSSNGGGSAATMAVSDTSGLGLSWTQQVKQNTAGDGYSGIWTAAMPATAASAPLTASPVPVLLAARAM